MLLRIGQLLLEELNFGQLCKLSCLELLLSQLYVVINFSFDTTDFGKAILCFKHSFLFFRKKSGAIHLT